MRNRKAFVLLLLGLAISVLAGCATGQSNQTGEVSPNDPAALVDKYYDYFSQNPQIPFLLSQENTEGFSDGQMVIFLLQSGAIPIDEQQPDSIPVDVFDTLSMKIFGKKIEDFTTEWTTLDESVSKVIVSAGWDFPTLCYVLKSYSVDEAGVIHAEFYGWEFFDSLWDEIDYLEPQVVKEKLTSGDSSFLPASHKEPMLIKMAFEEKEENGAMYLKYHHVWLTNRTYSGEIVPFA